MGTESGLHIYDRTQNQIIDLSKLVPEDHALHRAYITNIRSDLKGNLWLATLTDNLFFLPAAHSIGRLQLIMPLELNKAGLNGGGYPNSASVITPDHLGNVWVGSMDMGLHRFDMNQEENLRFISNPRDPESIPSNRAGDIHFDTTSQKLYYGSMGGGLGILDLNGRIDANAPFEMFEHDPLDSTTISDNLIADIIPGDENGLWIATYSGGLNFFDFRTQSFTRITMAHGLPSNNLWGGVFDQEGMLWISSNKGLIKIDPAQKMVMHTFNRADGLPTDEFHYFSFLKLRDDHLFFGTYNGFTIYDPTQIKVNYYQPEAIITSLEINNQIVTPTHDGLILRDISYLPDLTLHHRQNVVSFTLAATNYFDPDETLFEYQLSGLSEHWVRINPDRRIITYSNLGKGDYQFKVRAANDDGIWNPRPTVLGIHMKPAPWNTLVAKVGYLLLLLLIIFLILRNQRNRWQLRTNLAVQKQQALRLKEISDFKNTFFTNITHEIRTPLSIILGMTQNLTSKSKATLLQTEDMVQKNGTVLLRLVNQMLDLAKVESGTIKIYPKQADIVQFASSQLEIFKMEAAKKRINVAFQSNPPEIMMDFDPDLISKILQNLVGNAIKFSNPGDSVDISMEINQEHLELSVADSGMGIKEMDQEHVFDRFYQGSQNTSEQTGTGIGLALTKELVSFVGGEIVVDSVWQHGSTFMVRLPITQVAPFSPQSTPSTSDGEQAYQLAEGTQILIVEDNPDLVFYIRSCLAPEYQILEASNGRMGEEMAIEHVPDLIISDIMMPIQDGLAMCKTLKSDERTSHIPIILLTAKSSIEDRIAGLEQGADAYLAKPFSERELQVRIEKLLALREALRQKFASQLWQLKSKQTLSSQEEIFLEKVRELIEVNLTNDDLGPEFLRKKLFLSRTQLHRKLKAIIGQSTTQVINLVRIEKAKTLLTNSEMTIDQVAFECGYSSTSYFRRMFSKLVQTSPSEYRQHL